MSEGTLPSFLKNYFLLRLLFVTYRFRPFFTLCDAIFLNYTWNEENLRKSLLEAEKRSTDVFVGVDVFGRNCYGGGGYSCRKALKIIKKYQLSTAIFAPGWVFESQSQTKNFEQSQWK